MAGEQLQMAAQVEHVVRRLDGLSILPGAAGRFVSALFEMRLTPQELASFVEAEPALAVMMFELAKKHTDSTQQLISLRRLCEIIPVRDIRNGFFSLRIYLPLDFDENKIERRRQMVINSAAVAYCAREIAEQSNLDIDGDTAYAAGLLYNLGNFALDETMPRSFAVMAEQAKTDRANISVVQDKNLGVNYTILGKRLAAKWKLPRQIQATAWLHLARLDAIAQAVPDWRIVHAVHLAYLAVRKFAIAPCSYDAAKLPGDEQLAGLSTADLEDIAKEAEQHAGQRSPRADWHKELAHYSRAIQSASAQIAAEGGKAASESQRAQTKASHFDFATEFLLGIEPDAEPIEVAKRFVSQWQKFYQTGPACLYLTQPQVGLIDAVISGSSENGKIVTIKPPQNLPLVPRPIQKEFAVIDAGDAFGWLFAQLDTEFDAAQTKVAPLICHGRTVGVIIFEFHYPVATASLKEMFQETCFIAAQALDFALARDEQQRFAEHFAKLAMEQRTQDTKHKATDSEFINALAETAGGAAHELNNPLSVISGRAQLLEADEADGEKKNALRQIKDNCKELSAMVGDLMRYAEPAQPKKTLVATRQVIDEAAALAAMKTHREKVDLRIDIEDAVTDLFIDSGQIVSALANIIANAVESYDDESGPVTISVQRGGSTVKMEISDDGRGMDKETLA
ncbi:MAG: HDOD domain-containing protein, partial [Phycisphaerae bacterium]